MSGLLVTASPACAVPGSVSVGPTKNSDRSDGSRDRVACEPCRTGRRSATHEWPTYQYAWRLGWRAGSCCQSILPLILRPASLTAFPAAWPASLTAFPTLRAASLILSPVDRDASLTLSAAAVRLSVA